MAVPARRMFVLVVSILLAIVVVPQIGHAAGKGKGTGKWKNYDNDNWAGWFDTSNPPGLAADPRGCDQIDPVQCMLPYPNDWFTKPDATSQTGRRLNLNVLAMPRNVEGKPWSPRNYEDRYEGRVSVRRALVASLNAATLRVADAVGLDQVVATAQALGIDSHLDTVPAVTLGAFEVTPLELARAYLPFANGGLSPRGAATLTAIHTADGTSLDPGGEAAKTVLSPAGACSLCHATMPMANGSTSSRAMDSLRQTSSTPPPML